MTEAPGGRDATRVGVAGAGTMGAGIAQLACLGGYETVLYDAHLEALARGAAKLRSDLERGAEKGRWTVDEASAASERLETADALGGLSGCDLVVEAAPEILDLKRSLFADLERACGPEAVLATNTSSLPVGEIAADAERPERICGMHFFNPPALMKLVEVVAADATAPAAVETVATVAGRMGRTAVRCVDAPGFIVNRCNRPYALESLRILEDGLAGHEEIDAAMTELGGYRMGPFALMDLIGIDVNLEVARSFYRQRPLARWEPSPISERMVEAGRLGRKAERGFYDYGSSAESPPGTPGGEAEDVAGVVPVPPARGAYSADAILGRVVAALVNEASFALEEGVAESAADIDTAMKLGLNHPRGPFEWARELGPANVLARLDALGSDAGDDRYAAAPLLREWAGTGVAPA